MNRYRGRLQTKRVDQSGKQEVVLRGATDGNLQRSWTTREKCLPATKPPLRHTATTAGLAAALPQLALLGQKLVRPSHDRLRLPMGGTSAEPWQPSQLRKRHLIVRRGAHLR